MNFTHQSSAGKKSAGKIFSEGRNFIILLPPLPPLFFESAMKNVFLATCPDVYGHNVEKHKPCARYVNKEPSPLT